MFCVHVEQRGVSALLLPATKNSDSCDKGRFSFGKSSRLLRKYEFSDVFEHGQRVVDRYFVVLGKRAATHIERPRVGLVVSRKVGNAVVRNRVKRRIREVFRCREGNGAIDYVVVARFDAAGAAFKDISSSLLRSFTKLEKRLIQAGISSHEQSIGTAKEPH